MLIAVGLEPDSLTELDPQTAGWQDRLSLSAHGEEGRSRDEQEHEQYFFHENVLLSCGLEAHADFEDSKAGVGLQAFGIEASIVAESGAVDEMLLRLGIEKQQV